jgi:HEAT repeat protein
VILGRFGAHSAPAVPALIRGLGDPDASVRLASAHALGLIGAAARAALPALATREADPDERVRESAKAASYAIRGEDAGS